MNKQELIDKLKKQLTTPSVIKGSDFDCGHNYGIELAIIFARQLEEPEKPVVPQFVADWYDDNQDDFEFNLYRLCVDYDNCELDKEMMIWFRDKNNNPIQTLTAMHKFGYEVQKEKLYTVEIPNPNGGEYGRVFLGKYSSGKVGLHCWTSYKQIKFDDSWKKDKIAQLTEAEIKKDFGWAWQFAEEV